VDVEAKQELGAKTDKQTVEIYKDIQSAVQRYAKANDIDLVLHYTDPVEGGDPLSAANVTRKMQAAGCVPFWAADGLDITAQIIDMLNAK
jgi:Skp family chaperone for outer membrane proteins